MISENNNNNSLNPKKTCLRKNIFERLRKNGLMTENEYTRIMHKYFDEHSHSLDATFHNSVHWGDDTQQESSVGCIAFLLVGIVLAASIFIGMNS